MQYVSRRGIKMNEVLKAVEEASISVASLFDAVFGEELQKVNSFANKLKIYNGDHKYNHHNFSNPKFTLESPLVIFLVTNVSPLLGLS